jgi:hypothetical protein
MKSLRYICAQPATLFYAWQVEVMINNFLKNNIPPESIHIVSSYTKHVPIEWLKLQDKYREVGFFFYADQRVYPVYVSSIRPHILKQHFIEHPYLKEDAIFYHDCDIVFTKPVTWEQFLADDTWYLSDTIGYIGANYIKSKKCGIYERMCEIVDISESIPIKNELSSGGAQYIMKNVDHVYWDKVERDSEALYQFFLYHLQAFPQSPKYHPIQMWTADMWAVLWNAWYFKHETKVVKEMEFIWPNHRITDWDKHTIFHNAGIVGPGDNGGMFFKGSYSHTLPYNINPDDYNTERCSYRYVQEILDTAKTSCLL